MRRVGPWFPGAPCLCLRFKTHLSLDNHSHRRVYPSTGDCSHQSCRRSWWSSCQWSDRPSRQTSDSDTAASSGPGSPRCWWGTAWRWCRTETSWPSCFGLMFLGGREGADKTVNVRFSCWWEPPTTEDSVTLYSHNNQTSGGRRHYVTYTRQTALCSSYTAGLSVLFIIMSNRRWIEERTSNYVRFLFENLACDGHVLLVWWLSASCSYVL